MPNYALGALSVDGLVPLQAALKAMETDANGALKEVLNKAAKIVVVGAQRRVPVLSGALQSSIKVASGPRTASVREGSAKVPYAGFIDYGNKVHGGRGAVGRKDSVPRQFMSHGRILYPAYVAQKDNIHAVLARGLQGLIAEVGL